MVGLAASSFRRRPEKLLPDLALAGVFRRYDGDGDGQISSAEMRELCGCTEAEAEEMVAAADADGDGLVSIEELGALMVEFEPEGGEPSSDALQEAFSEYDEDGDGVITAEELGRALRRVLVGQGEEELTAEQFSRMVAAVDADGDGVISFDEFKFMMAS